jgi:hypothetical protein
VCAARVLVSRIRAARIRETGLTGYYHEAHLGTSALMTAASWSSGRKSITHRRTRKLAPGVVALSLIMITGAFVFVIPPGPLQILPAAAASPDCIQCPGGSGCEPNCGGGCNPTEIPIDIYSVQVTPKSTNSSLTWDESPAAQSTTLQWGNTTSYSYSQSVGGSGSYSVFLDYLQPNTTYHYLITAHQPSPGCTGTFYVSNTYTGSYQTGSDGPFLVSTGSYILGTVTNGAGSPAGSGIEVVASCIHPYELSPWSANNPWYVYSTTNSKGQYSLYVPSEASIQSPFTHVDICQADEPGGGIRAGYQVCLDNIGAATATFCITQSNDQVPGGRIWDGYWNETVLTWAPQVVDFVLPGNFVEYSVVQVQDYSNANVGNGYPNSTISYTSGSTYNTSSSHCWTVLIVLQGCSVSSNTIGTADTWSATGHNLVVTQNLWESGTVLFDVLSRTGLVTAEKYYAAEQPPVNEPASWPSRDNITAADAASNSSIYPLYGWGAGEGSQGEPVYSTSPDRGTVTVSSTSTVTGLTKGFTLDLDLSLYGVGVDVALVADHWSQMSTYTVTDTLSWTVYGNSLTVPVCYAVYGVGGSSSASGSTADAIGVWAFAPTYAGGVYSCPATQ